MASHSPGLCTLNELLLWHGEGRIPLRRFAKRDGCWQGLDSAVFYAQVRALEAGLRLRLGAAPGERVAILAESSPEWLLADFACLAAGVIDVPIYPTLTAEQVAFILNDCAAVGAFVSTPAQAAKIHAQQSALPALRWICCFADSDGGSLEEPGAPAGGPCRESKAALQATNGSDQGKKWQATWTELLAHEPADSAAAFAGRLRTTPPEQPATLLYTSGTTGSPKGLQLTHANLCANLNYSTLDFDYGHDERRLSILPLSHITERHMAYVDMLYGGEMYFAESLDRVPDYLRELQPTALVSVPRLYEKVADAVQAQVAQKSSLAQFLFRWAVKTGEAMIPYRLEGRTAPAWLRLRAALADRVAGRKLRAKLGGHLSKIISGGAALAPAVARLLLALGVMVDEGYGLSETSPVIALSRPGGRRLGSVGRPLENVEVKIAPDGEILVRGPAVFAGYYHLAEETAVALQDGWFHTGDVGRLDADGFLYLTDRKKDLLKTSGGKFIAPQPIEAKLKASGLIAEAVVIGDGHNYAVALLVPNWPALEAQNIACADHPAACTSDSVRAVFSTEVERVNATLARFETIKKFALIPSDFTIESGELTPTIKVRRRAVEANYRDVIAGLYR